MSMSGRDEERCEQELGQLLDRSRLPQHVAIIMDGNGRWAQQRGLPRVEGHRQGAESLRTMVKACVEYGVPYLTAYAFSTENWKRPPDEVNKLMQLLVEYLYNELDELHANGVRLRGIGDIKGLPEQAQKALTEAERKTARNKRLCLNLALNYGGRSELVQAVRRLADDAVKGKINPDDIDESIVSSYLYTSGMPDPDLLIRPAGEFRVSNFLLWQIAYAEFWITPVLWPDFGRKEFLEALVEYQRRERRFGGLNVCSG
ncbi:MAG: isoprenyl transferase [Peptococcaceae bacterium]|nr:isoprenyl transferase [Peptococcaceae bacterium]